ncbi:MAG: SAM-dependent methyltransferase, type 11, and glycosyltransferase [Thermoleophilia bacterium]|nr:SAM-dependent methyltransferase, type 11, and glycosyltransferase [Thermoleophilia bacterium]
MSTADRPVTSIVILTRGQLDYTRRCVASIAQWTPEPHELVFVDNDSPDGTLEYLRSLPDAFVVDNDANLGFGGGCNQGIAAARGERILLLNNDVVVTEGWLGELHDALDSAPEVGIVGPRSNRIAGSQQVDAVGYDEESLDGLEAWAQQWRAEHSERTEPLSRLVGFCMLMDRAVVERIGGFDLRYGLGNFEDDDLCLRAAVAGFGCRVAHGSFIHHFGSRTFVGERIDYAATMSANFQRFRAAWRMGEDDVDAATGGYYADRVASRTSYDAARHFAPLTGVPDDGAQVMLEERRGRVVAVCCDRLDADGTRAMLSAALTAYGPGDDVTLAIRVDPRDATSVPILERLADELGDDALPDVALVTARDEHDGGVLRIADAYRATTRRGAATATLARHLGTSPD